MADDIFHLLSTAARIDKSKRKKRMLPKQPAVKVTHDAWDEDETSKSRDRKGKRDNSEEKLAQIHQEQVNAFRNSLNIKVKGDAKRIVDPISSFDELEGRTSQVIGRNVPWKTPTPIQMQAIPILLHGEDLMATAPTGSGKTGAFVWPLIFHVAKTKERLSALVMAPTHELAVQLHSQIQQMCNNLPIRAQLLQKSNAKQQGNAQILVATPKRLVDSLKEEWIKLDAIRFIVLDEADRLLESKDASSSFLGQMDSVLSTVPAKAIRALFSATLPNKELAQRFLRNPVDVSIGKTSAANSNIEQKLQFVGSEQGKLLAIRQLVQTGELQPPALVFCDSQDRAQALFREVLYEPGLRVDVIHAGRSKAARQRAIDQFRQGNIWLLICTDLVARGVDLKAVRMVINYDLPVSGITYVHRVGRTGRAGRQGSAITFVTEDDFGHLRTVANIMKQSGCEVADWMLQAPKRDSGRKRGIDIDTTPKYDRQKQRHKKRMVRQSKDKKEAQQREQVES